MKTLSRFVVKFTSLIIAVLSSFDRIIFKGHSALAAPRELEYFVDRILKVHRSDFMKNIAPEYSDRLVTHARNAAQKAGRIYMYRTGQFRKDEWAQNLIRDHGISEGLVGILCTQETCPCFALVPGPGRPQFVSRPRQQRVLYYYFLDRQFGLIHVRLQTWLPFTVQVYVNGHEWLAQQMLQKKLGFVQQHNAFTQLDDHTQAQRLADRFAWLNWSKILDRWARQVNPLLRDTLAGYPVHWVVDQAKYATDLLFKSRAGLAGLYRSLLEYAVQTFTPKDILGFLRRKWDRRFNGEVHTHYEDDRWFGTQIKHRMKSNWLKMYDKSETDKGHGRIEKSAIESTSSLAEYLQPNWASCAQVFRLTRERKFGKKIESQVILGIASLNRGQAGPKRLLDFAREHWGIENGLHGVRDWTLREDASRIRKGPAAEVMTALRNIVIFLFHRLRRKSAAVTTRYYLCHAEESLKFLSFPI